MILADTSVWIAHFRGKESRLAPLLDGEQVVIHPFVIGELALGRLKDRSPILHGLQLLPRVSLATDEETLLWVDRRRVYERGIGWIDAHILLCSILDGVALWTKDKALASVARSCGAALFGS